MRNIASDDNYVSACLLFHCLCLCLSIFICSVSHMGSIFLNFIFSYLLGEERKMIHPAS